MSTETTPLPQGATPPPSAGPAAAAAPGPHLAPTPAQQVAARTAVTSAGPTLATDIAVLGGGVGGVAAALAAAQRGLHVVLSEEGDRLGGQLTAQGVPPDEHPWIEQFGATRSYRRLRDAIREYYRHWYPLTPGARRDPELNPGQGRVSKLCHEPRVSQAVLEAMLAPFIAAGRITVLLHHRVLGASCTGDRVDAVTLTDRAGSEVHVVAPYFIDATELGDLAPVAGMEYHTGFEAQAETGEPHAPATAQPFNVQALSWVFAVDHRPGEDHTIARPAHWDEWRTYAPAYWPGPMIGLTAPDPRTLEPVTRTFTPNATSDKVIADQSVEGGDRELWEFRRVLARATFTPGFLDSDVTIVNWPMIDYVGGDIISATPQEREFYLAQAREQSEAMLYWLQTEAPRPDGGTGWPGLRLRGDVLGTADGFAAAPYIRESRRIVPLVRVVEQDIALAERGTHGARLFPDSVGIGMYRLDLHPSTGGDNYIDIPACPFQIPLGALIPVRMRNVLAGGKNLGTTHITNGCYRLHPIEWNAGEAAASAAAYCLAHGTEPHQLHADPTLLEDFQRELSAAGVELTWPAVRGY